MNININQEEYELLISFKNQLNEKIDEFRDDSEKVEKKEKEIIDLAAFYNNEKIKNLKQLNVLQEEIKKCLVTFNDFEQKISTQKALIGTLEGRVCVLRKVLVERNLKN